MQEEWGSKGAVMRKHAWDETDRDLYGRAPRYVGYPIGRYSVDWGILQVLAAVTSYERSVSGETGSKPTGEDWVETHSVTKREIT